MVPISALSRVLEKISIQKGEVIKDIIINGADHFFNEHNNEMIEAVGKYLDSRLDKEGNFINIIEE
jgi:alpha/beta superfamily hydrolase